MTYRIAAEKKLIGSNERYERKVRRALKLGTYINPANPTERCCYKKLISNSITNKDGVLFYKKQEQISTNDPMAKSTSSGYDLGDTLGNTLGDSQSSISRGIDSGTSTARTIKPSRETTAVTEPALSGNDGSSGGNAESFGRGNEGSFRGGSTGSFGGGNDGSFRDGNGRSFSGGSDGFFGAGSAGAYREGTEGLSGGNDGTMMDVSEMTSESSLLLSPQGTDDSRMTSSDLSKSQNQSISGVRHMSSEAPPPSPGQSPPVTDPSQDVSRPVKGRRIYVTDSYGNRITLREAVKQGVIDSETAKQIREKQGA